MFGIVAPRRIAARTGTSRRVAARPAAAGGRFAAHRPQGYDPATRSASASAVRLASASRPVPHGSFF
jgi:hypothetical protein